MLNSHHSECVPTDWSLQRLNPRGRTGLGMSYSNLDISEKRVTTLRAPVYSRVEEEEEEEEEWGYLDENQVYLRSKFYESWLWMDVSLQGQADKDG